MILQICFKKKQFTARNYKAFKNDQELAKHVTTGTFV